MLHMFHFISAAIIIQLFLFYFLNNLALNMNNPNCVTYFPDLPSSVGNHDGMDMEYVHMG